MTRLGMEWSAGYATEVKRSLLCLGLSVRHTPIEVREKMSIPEVSLHACMVGRVTFGLFRQGWY